jgi:hypothetical protein
MTLDVDEFIRRFLIHVLPKGFHRIRHYGLFAGCNRAETIANVRHGPKEDSVALDHTEKKHLRAYVGKIKEIIDKSPLLGRAALVVEGDDALSRAAHVGDDEAGLGISSPGCHSTLATTRRGLVQLAA